MIGDSEAWQCVYYLDWTAQASGAPGAFTPTIGPALNWQITSHPEVTVAVVNGSGLVFTPTGAGTSSNLYSGTATTRVTAPIAQLLPDYGPMREIRIVNQITTSGMSANFQFAHHGFLLGATITNIAAMAIGWGSALIYQPSACWGTYTGLVLGNTAAATGAIAYDETEVRLSNNWDMEAYIGKYTSPAAMGRGNKRLQGYRKPGSLVAANADVSTGSESIQAFLSAQKNGSALNTFTATYLRTAVHVRRR